MRARTVLSLLNLAAMTATFVVWLAFPRFAEYALYLAVGWIVVACTLLYTSWAARPLGTPSGAAGRPGPASSTPSVSEPAPTSASPAPIGFCIFCANDLPVGASQCPACGHPVRIR
jgi:hypothetical protein